MNANLEKKIYLLTASFYLFCLKFGEILWNFSRSCCQICL